MIFRTVVSCVFEQDCESEFIARRDAFKAVLNLLEDTHDKLSVIEINTLNCQPQPDLFDLLMRIKRVTDGPFDENPLDEIAQILKEVEYKP